MNDARKARLARRAERGGVAVIVATMLGMGVLLGASALALDVGNALYERRQLQNGADAGSRALAKICAADALKCTTLLPSTISAVDTANGRNAYDGTSGRYTQRLTDPVTGLPNTTGICGRNPLLGTLPACPSDATSASATEWTDCPALPSDWASGAAPYVQVYTQTKDSAGNSVLGSIVGGQSSTPTACSRYGWGPIAGAQTFPLTFLQCEKDEAAALGVETSLPLKYKENPTNTSCQPAAVPSGGDFHGGFGWLDAVDCNVPTTIPAWIKGSTGVGAGNSCVSDLQLNEVYLIPIFDCIADTDANPPCTPGSPGGTNTWYHIVEYAAFELTGYKLASTGGWQGNPSAAAKTECMAESKDNKCLVGKFIADYEAGDVTVDPSTQPTGGEPIGFEHIG